MKHFLIPALVTVLLGAASIGCQSNGDAVSIERSDILFWLDLIDANVKSASEIAQQHLAEDAPGQEKIESFLSLYIPISITLRNNLEVFYKYYAGSDMTRVEQLRFAEVEKRVAELDKLLVEKGVSVD